MLVYIDLNLKLALSKLQLLIKLEGRMLGQWLYLDLLLNLELRLEMNYGLWTQQ